MDRTNTLFEYDPLAQGSKGLVFVGQKILVYRRDDKTDVYPLYLDLPGGRREGKETPFQAFQRETKEEFGLDINQKDIVYCRRYPSIVGKNKYAYFPVAKLPGSTSSKIIFGDEGLEYMLMSLDEFINHKDAWPRLKKFAADYRAAIQK